MKPQAEHSMTDFEKFAKALYSFDSVCKKNDKDNWMLYREFIESIKDLKCDDFRFFFHLAYYQNTNGPLEEAKSNIDKSINLLLSIKDGFSATEENYAKILEAVLISFDKSVKHDLDECNLYHSFCGFSKEFVIDGQPSEVFQP